MPMRITVLGCGAAYPRPGGACSGFLVEGGGVNVLVDAGNGIFSRLTERIPHGEVDALVLSHSHADHIADVLPLMYARGFDGDTESPVPVYAPPDVRSVVSAPLGSGSIGIFERVFTWRPVADAFEVGDLRFEAFRTVHPVETYGLRISEAGVSCVYTADTAGFPELPGHCRSAELLICEATFVGDEEGPPGMHLWAREAGEIAAKAEVGQLRLTHVWASHDLSQAVQEAAGGFDGDLEAARDGDTYEL